MTDSQPVSRMELLGKIEEGWNAFQSYLKTLTDDQLTKLTDAQGWTVKDHLTHLVVWEDGVYALLEKQPRAEWMGLDSQTLASGDYDKMNAIIQQHEKDKPLAEVLKQSQEVHQRLVNKIKMLTDADLTRPCREFQSDSSSTTPIINLISGNTYGHYEEHQPWIEAIVKGSR